MEIKEIIVPENWEVFIEDGVATFKEKKQVPPRSWGEFCENYPIRKENVLLTMELNYMMPKEMLLQEFIEIGVLRDKKQKHS